MNRRRFGFGVDRFVGTIIHIPVFLVPTAHSLRIFVVDDEEMISLTAAAILCRSGIDATGLHGSAGCGRGHIFRAAGPSRIRCNDARTLRNRASGNSANEAQLMLIPSRTRA
jgi:hypothetical protein